MTEEPTQHNREKRRREEERKNSTQRERERERITGRRGREILREAAAASSSSEFLNWTLRSTQSQSPLIIIHSFIRS